MEHFDCERKNMLQSRSQERSIPDKFVLNDDDFHSESDGEFTPLIVKVHY